MRKSEEEVLERLMAENKDLKQRAQTAEAEARLAPLQWSAEKRAQFDAAKETLHKLQARQDLSDNERVSIARASGELGCAWIEQIY